MPVEDVEAPFCMKCPNFWAGWHPLVLHKVCSTQPRMRVKRCEEFPSIIDLFLLIGLFLDCNLVDKPSASQVRKVDLGCGAKTELRRFRQTGASEVSVQAMGILGARSLQHVPCSNAHGQAIYRKWTDVDRSHTQQVGTIRAF